MEVRMDGKKVKIFTRHNFFRGFVIFALGVAFALSYVLFVTPNDFAPSGINGIAVMVQASPKRTASKENIAENGSYNNFAF